MDSPTSRSLRLLALLQTGRRWTGDELADRLGVAARTARRDIARLRSLGYDVRSAPGPGGAYFLAASIKIPPLVLDADEVCTLVTGLLMLEAGAEDAVATTVRTKLEQLLPPSLRHRAAAVTAATQVLTTAGTADWPSLGMLADAIAQGKNVGFTYTDQHGRVSDRKVQPYRQVLRDRTWYLIAYDTQCEDWRLFRADRIQNLTVEGPASGNNTGGFPDESIEHWLLTDFGRRTQDEKRRLPHASASELEE